MTYKVSKSYTNKLFFWPIVKGKDFNTYHNEDEKCYNSTFESFFATLRNKIEAKNCVREFMFVNRTLYIDTVEFINGEYVESYTELEIASALINDSQFFNELNALLYLYTACAQETMKNIAILSKKNSHLIERDVFLKRQVARLIEDYSNGKLPEKLTPNDLEDICCFLSKHRKEYAMNSNFHFGGFRQVCLNIFGFTARHFILTMLFSTGLGCVCLFILPKMWPAQWILLFPTVGTANFACKISGVYHFFGYRSRLHFIDSLLQKMEKDYGIDLNRSAIPNLSNLEQTEKDILLDAISKDMDYIKVCGVNKFLDECNEFRVLLSEYNKLKGSENIDRWFFLNWLSEVEKRIYSKNIKPGFIRIESVFFDEDSLIDRLQFLGYDDLDGVENRFIVDIKSQVEEILKMPYAGCEIEILGLICLAQDYVRYKHQFVDDPMAFGVETGKMYGVLEDIENTVKTKRNELMDSGDAPEMGDVPQEVKKFFLQTKDGNPY